ncbi:hypothetical protein RSK20926_00540 [Roseobacter sp. SK209-2-6]|nr:hypothetical protein RSK20926_00540 [Roseobacter sp. SK209-2-6]
MLIKAAAMNILKLTIKSGNFLESFIDRMSNMAFLIHLAHFHLPAAPQLVNNSTTAA